jgi:TFIIF-interacting CTD phosphatase-like protein
MQISEKKILILDLDETLIYADEKPLEREADFQAGQYSVYKRPHLETFLSFCFEQFDVAVWTTATMSYAEEILKNILCENQKLLLLWTRERCTLAFDSELREHYFTKRMYKLRRRGYRLESIIVIDDRPAVWESSYGNLVGVAPFFGDENDDELKFLPIYLETLKNAVDIRAIEKRNWQMKISQK